jgi:cyclohexanone monooxygenase
MRENDHDRLSISEEKQALWAEHVNAIASQLIFAKVNTRSWYMGDNVPGKPRQFLAYAGGFGAFRAICDEIADRGYPDIEFSTHRSDASATAPAV